MTLQYWCDLYEQLKFESLCLDIEVTSFGGPIAVVGLYKPKDGVIEVDSYIRGRNLTIDNLKAAFVGCKMLITFNGLKFDVPKIRSEFPGVLPEKIPVLDLYLFIRMLGINTNLKVMENTLRIDRLDDFTKKRHIATRLWRSYESYRNEKDLGLLLEYNRQDTANLYPMAEQLVKLAGQ